MGSTYKGRLFIVAAVAMLANGLTGSAHATEVPVFSDVIAVSGCVDVSPAVMVLSNPGTFNGPVDCQPPFNNLPRTVCAFVSDPQLPNIPPVPTPAQVLASLEVNTSCTFDFDGSYSNIVCGTGLATGVLNIEDDAISFTIAFVAGQGVVVGTSPSDDSAVDRWAGVVTIQPTAPLVPPCPVTQFRFTAAAAAVDSPA